MAASGKTTNYLFPYPLSSDVVDVSGDIQLLATKLDTAIDEIIQDVTGLMISTGNIETGISVTYDDASGKLNFALDDNYLKDTSASIFSGNHIGIDATYNNTTNKITLEVTGGGGGSGGTSNASMSDMWWLGA